MCKALIYQKSKRPECEFCHLFPTISRLKIIGTILPLPSIYLHGVRKVQFTWNWIPPKKWQPVENFSCSERLKILTVYKVYVFCVDLTTNK
jgi:hypothetical protein